MPRFRSDVNSPDLLVASIVAVATQTVTLAVGSAMEAAGAQVAGNLPAVAFHAGGLGTRATVATSDVARLAAELERSPAGDDLIATAGASITGLQYALLTIAAAVQEVAGGSTDMLAAAEALRHAALTLDESLPAYQPRP